MGLDMYLSRRTYVKNWDRMPPEERHEITVKLNGEPRPGIKPERISYIIEEVAYWRKANAIHKWFVDNVQGGEDECREHHVSNEQLAELIEKCKTALSHRGDAKAGKILPTQGGFFFGSTQIDEWYFRDLEETVEMLEPLLTDGSGGDLYYRSSW